MAPPSGLCWPWLVPLGSDRIYCYLYCHDRTPDISIAIDLDLVHQWIQKAAEATVHNHFELDVI